MEKEMIVKNNLRELLLNVFNEYRKEFGYAIALEESAEIFTVISDNLNGKKSKYDTNEDCQRLKEYAKQEVKNAFDYLMISNDKNAIKKEFVDLFRDITGK